MGLLSVFGLVAFNSNVKDGDGFIEHRFEHICPWNDQSSLGLVA